MKCFDHMKEKNCNSLDLKGGGNHLVCILYGDWFTPVHHLLSSDVHILDTILLEWNNEPRILVIVNSYTRAVNVCRPPQEIKIKLFYELCARFYFILQHVFKDERCYNSLYCMMYLLTSQENQSESLLLRGCLSTSACSKIGIL